jgi:hypothetical protein
MKCTICSQNSKFSFSKIFNKLGLDKIDYYTCENCGYTVSKTHLEMSNEIWSELNSKYHSYHGTDQTDDDKNWVTRLCHQSEIITELKDIIPHKNSWIDYGCGDGKLSQKLKNNKIELLNFDICPCTKDIEYLTYDELTSKKYDFVVTTSVFEHLREYSEIDFIFNLVSNTGALGIHTFISSTVPCNSDWFYLLPVHCAFQTNKSMKILFDRYDFKFSLYNYDARFWILFKEIPDITVLEKLNVKAPNKYYFKNDFMDYWK